ncbi:unnamed protein product [Diplocarpon coronariae]
MQVQGGCRAEHVETTQTCGRALVAESRPQQLHGVRTSQIPLFKAALLD